MYPIMLKNLPISNKCHVFSIQNSVGVGVGGRGGGCGKANEFIIVVSKTRMN